MSQVTRERWDLGGTQMEELLSDVARFKGESTPGHSSEISSSRSLSCAPRCSLQKLASSYTQRRSVKYAALTNAIMPPLRDR